MKNPHSYITVEGLEIPDLRPSFKHIEWRPRNYSQGVLVASDFADKQADDPVFRVFKRCGFFCMSEAAILYNIARSVGGDWLDIGGLTGWTAAHLVAAGCGVIALDPMYKVPTFWKRAHENLTTAGFAGEVLLWGGTSNEFFTTESQTFNGIVIDGDHTAPHPLQDAINASQRVVPGGVILFHDLIYGGPQEGLRYLTEHGWKSKVYSTPHKVGVCWKGSFAPPEHVPDPNLWKEI